MIKCAGMTSHSVMNNQNIILSHGLVVCDLPVVGSLKCRVGQHKVFGIKFNSTPLQHNDKRLDSDADSEICYSNITVS